MAELFIRERPEVDAKLVEAIREQSAATLYEAAGKVGAMDHTIRPMGSGLRLCGRAITVQSQPGDNLTLHAAIAMARPGDVIVAVGDTPVNNFLDLRRALRGDKPGDSVDLTIIRDDKEQKVPVRLGLRPAE